MSAQVYTNTCLLMRSEYNSLLSLFIFLSILSSGLVSAQSGKTLAYAYLREGDVLWSKKIWRTIDLREKINFPLYYPEVPLDDRMSLFDVIKTAVFSEGLTVYSLNGIDFDDQFRFPIKTKDDLLSVFAIIESIPMLDEEGYSLYNTTGEAVYVSDTSWVTSADIIEYKIKEEWFFDKQRSIMDVRIIGIAPVVYSFDESGEIRGKTTLFWLYFPECRFFFQSEVAFNRSNGAQQLSFDDLFSKRYFSSYITKESSVHNRSIMDYSSGVNSLIESDRIKDELIIYEHDMWSY